MLHVLSLFQPPYTWNSGSHLHRDVAAKITTEEYTTAQKAQKVFTRWIHESVLTLDANGNDEAVMLLRMADFQPMYRDEPMP